MIKNVIKTLGFLLFSTQLNAYTTADFKLFQAAREVGCSDPLISNQGTIHHYITASDLSFADNKLQIELETISRVCLVQKSENSRQFYFKTENPFSGFAVPYFDNDSQKMSTREEKIEPSAKANRWEIIIHSDYSGKSIRKTVQPNANLSSKVILTFAPADLLSSQELSRLDQGDTVSVRATLFQILNLTTTLDQACYQFGDRLVQTVNFSFKISK